MDYVIEVKNIIESLNVTYDGMMRGVDDGKETTLLLFTDPVTKSTLAIDIRKTLTKAVKERIKQSRTEFGVAYTGDL